MTESDSHPRPVSVRMRSAARLAAVQTLFQIEGKGAEPTQAITFFKKHFLPRLLADFGLEALNDSHYTQLVSGVVDKGEAIDTMLSGYLKEGWTWHRLNAVDRVVLRTAFVEATTILDTPIATLISEFVALAEVLGGDTAFVNAVLDNVLKDNDWQSGSDRPE